MPSSTAMRRCAAGLSPRTPYGLPPILRDGFWTCRPPPGDPTSTDIPPRGPPPRGLQTRSPRILPVHERGRPAGLLQHDPSPTIAGAAPVTLLAVPWPVVGWHCGVTRCREDEALLI